MKNVGSTDRLIRLVLGLGMVFGGIAGSGGLACVSTIVGVVVTYSGISGNCPFYAALEINTCCPASANKNPGQPAS